ncbi:MAG: hypothetical protein OK457_10570 [Thaumarchaeota archaeon]|nr:hypothetical protein [Nitrososphaerota archaeon]
MKRKTKSAVVAVILILLGLIFVAIAFSQVPLTTSILNQKIDVKLSSPYTSFGVDASHYLNGHPHGNISGTVQSSDCCIDFLIFTNTAWNNWIANGMRHTNSSNSPVVTIDWFLLKSGTSTPFAFAPDPSTIYMLAFYNNNRSQWNTNSSIIMHVFADISISYTEATTAFLVYPAIALLLAGVFVILWTARK